jgi:Uma2 family endonuclease
MAEPATPIRMSASEYLAWEREQPEKHEFHAGEVFAMAGGSPRHNLLSGRMLVQLSAALPACHVLSSDQRIAAEAERYVYADCVAVCGEVRMAPETSDVLASPTVVVEVLSKRTERYDRGDTWAAYQRLPSLTDYLLVAKHSARVEHYRRERAREWRYSVHGVGDTIELASGAKLEVDRIYEGALDLPSD